MESERFFILVRALCGVVGLAFAIFTHQKFPGFLITFSGFVFFFELVYFTIIEIDTFWEVDLVRDINLYEFKKNITICSYICILVIVIMLIVPSVLR